MVMYLGAEKAGIRLADYRNMPFRVGELMFDDESFNPVKGKTDELFSSLFHRRFVTPELAYSETTAYPARRLSLRTRLAKLAVSTISDVRNTMFMCDFPKDHWPSLAPAIQHHAKLHPVIAGHTPRGPSNISGAKRAAMSATTTPTACSWPWEFPSRSRASRPSMASPSSPMPTPRRPTVCHRPAQHWWDGRKSGLSNRVRAIPESWPELFTWKRELLPQLDKTPYIEGETPVVCAWYPTARTVLLWNLSQQRQDLTLRHGDVHRPVSVNGLDVA